MNHRRGIDRHQTLLLPERIEDYIDPDNPVRFLDAFVASLNVRELGLTHAVVQNTGRPRPCAGNRSLCSFRSIIKRAFCEHGVLPPNDQELSHRRLVTLTAKRN